MGIASSARLPCTHSRSPPSTATRRFFWTPSCDQCRHPIFRSIGSITRPFLLVVVLYSALNDGCLLFQVTIYHLDVPPLIDFFFLVCHYIKHRFTFAFFSIFYHIESFRQSFSLAPCFTHSSHSVVLRLIASSVPPTVSLVVPTGTDPHQKNLNSQSCPPSSIIHHARLDQ
jgi:hypothetical protein